jgi:hypothetical protein
MPFSKLLTASLLGLLAIGVGSVKADVLITVDKAAQRMSVTVDGERLHSWPVSSGKSGYETPAGSFTPFRLEKDHTSKEWDDAPMPHAIFFTGRGHAIHGSDATRRLGSPASHGCIRLSRAKAAMLFDIVRREGLQNTKIVIRGDESNSVARKERRSKIAKRKQPSEPAYAATGSVRRAQRFYEGADYAPAYGYGAPINTGAIYDWR